MKTVAAPTEIEVGLFEKKLAEAAELLEPKLQELLPKDGRLAEAMRYAVLGSGKRFRPFLVFETAELFGARREASLNVAAAIEFLHCYSLVHDDLPAMDDDDMRRGKPSVHKKFDEATAILAGDALQTLAFEVMASQSAELAISLAKAAGWAGMAGGQQLDLGGISDVAQMSAMKTGALIRFSAASGAIVGNAASEDRVVLERYGEQLGLAFQISDDILDAGKDAAVGKKTFVTTFGLSNAKRKLAEASGEAVHALEKFGERADALQDAALYLLQRTK